MSDATVHPEVSDSSSGVRQIDVQIPAPSIAT